MAKQNSPLNLRDKSILFVTFSRWEKGRRTPTTGSLDPFRDIIVPKVKKLVILDQPHPGSDRVMPVIEFYKNGSGKPKIYKSSFLLYFLSPLLKAFNVSSTQPTFKIRDFLSVIDWSFRDKTIYDYCVCLESVNTIAAIILRSLGRVKKVVYYVSDYSPNRYKLKWINSFYLMLDRFAATHADFIWDVSPAMQKARIAAGLDPEKSVPVIYVPNGLYDVQIKVSPPSKIDNHALVYMGTVGSDMGPDIAIKALALVLKKYPDSKLHMIGGSDNDSAWLKKIVEKINIGNSVIFHGFVESWSDMAAIMRNCAIGVAPYRDIPGSIRKYADAGKIRIYCGSGLPVVSSQVPPLGRTVEEKGAAIVTADNPKSFASTIIKIFENHDLYMRLRKNAIIFAKNSTWENTFLNAFSKMI